MTRALTWLCRLFDLETFYVLLPMALVICPIMYWAETSQVYEGFQLKILEYLGVSVPFWAIAIPSQILFEFFLLHIIMHFSMFLFQLTLLLGTAYYVQKTLA